MEGVEAGLAEHLVAAPEVGSVGDLVEAAKVVKAVASAAQTFQEATRHILTLAVRTPGCMELAEAARVAARTWAHKKDLGALVKVDDQYLAHEVVTEVRAANRIMVLLAAVCLAVADLD